MGKKKYSRRKKKYRINKKNLQIISKYKNVKLLYIKAHTGLKDQHSIGNENADTLAGEAIDIRKFIYTDSKSKNNKFNNKLNNNHNNFENSNSDESNDYYFTFGKYKNKAAIWVKEHDPGYILNGVSII